MNKPNITVSEQALTRKQFCTLEAISLSTYYDLKERGYAPDELCLPGTRVRRITPAARRAWHKLMAKLKKSKAARLEAARRRELAKQAAAKVKARKEAMGKSKVPLDPG